MRRPESPGVHRGFSVPDDVELVTRVALLDDGVLHSWAAIEGPKIYLESRWLVILGDLQLIVGYVGVQWSVIVDYLAFQVGLNDYQ